MGNGSSEADRILPDAACVAAGAMALAAISCRGMMELDDDKESAESRRLRLCDWLAHLDIADMFEEDEDLLIRTPVGHLDEHRTIDAVWRCEGLLVLAWSLGRTGLIAHDEDCDFREAVDSLGFMRSRSETVLRQPTLRDRTEIAHWTDTTLTIHWRLRQFTVDPVAIDFADWVARHNWGPLTLADVPLIEGDLAIGGKRIDRVPEDWRHHVLSIAQECHQAFNWLMGFDPVYSKVPTHT